VDDPRPGDQLTNQEVKTMAKRPYRGRSSKPAKKMNPNDLMGQFQEMQQQMAAQQQALAEETVTVTAAGGAITIVITGHQRVESIAIDPEMLNPEDVEMLQDALLAGINAAIEQSQTMAAAKMEGITGGLDVNSLLGGL
jgi:DNA-binding YbaB/EbfC family protein